MSQEWLNATQAGIVPQDKKEKYLKLRIKMGKPNIVKSLYLKPRFASILLWDIEYSGVALKADIINA